MDLWIGLLLLIAFAMICVLLCTAHGWGCKHEL